MRRAAVILAIFVLGACGGGTALDQAAPTTVALPETTSPGAPTTIGDGPTVTEPTPTEAPVAEETVSQRNAVRSAEDYLGYTAFSRSGLIKQLEFEKFSTEDATYAVDKVNPDWFEQAAKSAESYLDYTSFSRSGLIDQLIFEGFTPEQAEHGVNSVGL